MSDIKTGLAKLREPFPPNAINLLPKPHSKDAPKGNCKECGGYHGLPAAHLKYIGHAALTDRLLDTDPEWTWEPVAFRDGLPAFDVTGGLWIRLTVCGVSRLGYGHAGSKSEPGAREKEVIGDALRNAAMRFGAGLELWHKGVLHMDEDDELDDNFLSTADYNEFEKRIRAELTKEKAKAVWQEAAKKCAEINDLASSCLLKAILLEHAASLDKVAGKQV